MSDDTGFGMNVAEKFFGLIILLTGALTLYYTLTSNSELMSYTGLFGFLSMVLVVIGLVLILAKVE